MEYIMSAHLHLVNLNGFGTEEAQGGFENHAADQSSTSNPFVMTSPASRIITYMSWIHLKRDAHMQDESTKFIGYCI